MRSPRFFLVQDDKILRLTQVLLDPNVSAERFRAFEDFVSTDVPDFKAWIVDFRKRTQTLFPSEVHMVKSVPEFHELLAKADHVFIESFAFGAKEIALATRLKSVHQFGLHTDHIDLQACQHASIPVHIVRRLTNIAVAEHTLMLCLNLTRRFSFVNGLIRSSDLKKAGLPYRPYDLSQTANANYGRIPSLTTLHGKTLGLLGFGEIAKEVANLAQAFGMKILCHRRTPLSADEQNQFQVQSVDFKSLLRQSHFLSIHLPLHAATQNLINAKALALMPKGAYLVNTARAAIVEHEALRAALADQHLAGAAFDVHYQEPASEDESLLALPNFISTPHMSGTSRVNNLSDVESMIRPCLMHPNTQSNRHL
jgi:phosphoglycerate dehydrogenase-like enzyme